MAKKKLSKEEKKRLLKEQKQKDALRSYRFRGFKNFLFWLAGVLTCLILIVTSLFVGVAVIPIGTYLGDNADEYVSEDVASKSLLTAILKANTYDMTDFPLIAEGLDSLIKGANLDKYVEIDVDKMKKLKFDENFATELQSCIKIVATLDSVGGPEILEDFGKLEVFDWETVETDEMPVDVNNDGVIDKDAESGEFLSNPKLYYYNENDAIGLRNTKGATHTDGWKRAFDDNGNRLCDNAYPLYYANLSCVPILDFMDLIDESFGRLKLTNLIEIFGGKNLDSSLIADILGEKTVSQIQDITGDDILIETFLGKPDADNQQIYDILCSAVEAESGIEVQPGQLSLGHLQKGIDVFGISLSTFKLDSSITKILFDAVNGGIEEFNKENEQKPAEEQELPKEKVDSETALTLGHLTMIDPGHISFDSVLPYAENKDMYKMILKILGKQISDWTDDNELSNAVKDLTVDSFSDIDLGNIFLDTFDLDSEMLKILFDAVNNKIRQDNDNKIDEGKESEVIPLLQYESDLTVEHLSMLDPNYITISSLLPYSSNKDKYNILLQACGTDLTDLNDIQIENLADQMSINSFKNLDFNKVSISTFGLQGTTLNLLFDTINAKIKADNEKILEDGLQEGEQLTPLLVSASKLNVGHLISLDTNYIKICSILAYKDTENNIDNSKLYKIILQASGHNIMGLNDNQIENLAKELDVKAFSKFDESKIALNTILPIDATDKYGNKVNEGLYNILLDDVNAGKSELNKKTADQITIADLTSFEIDNIKLSTVLPCENDKKEPINTMLYSILLDVVNGDCGNMTAWDLKLSDLNDFTCDNMHLSTILKPKENASLYKILLDVVNSGKPENKKLENKDLKLSHLSSFDVSKIHLRTVLGDKATGNVILDRLIEKNVEISGLASAINSLSLYEMYGQNCFVELDGDEGDIARYRKVGDAYILDTDGNYKISKKAGIWLFLCFDFTDEAIEKSNSRNALGCRVKYTISQATFSALTDSGSGKNISTRLTKATIRQLIDAGILEKANTLLYIMALEDVVKINP